MNYLQKKLQTASLQRRRKTVHHCGAEPHALQKRQRVKWINKNKQTKIDAGVMCCLPRHALSVLCPSGLLSRSGSACQLTADGHVVTLTTFNQIIWWQLWPPEPQATAQSTRKTRGPLKSPHHSIAPETDGDFRTLLLTEGKSSTGNVSHSGFYSPLCKTDSDLLVLLYNDYITMMMRIMIVRRWKMRIKIKMTQPQCS